MYNPIISVVIPCYNAANFLPRSIDSVLSQTFKDFELLVVDDCSTDSTEEVVAGYLSDTRVRYMRHQQNGGPSAARNTGIRAARGELVAFLDSDDYWLPQKLELQVAALSDSGAGACCAASYVTQPDQAVILNNRPLPAQRESLYRSLLFANRIPGSASSLVARRRCFDEAGLFDENLKTSEDADMWVRLASMFRFAYVDVPLVYITRQPDSNSSDALSVAQGHRNVLEKRERDVPEDMRYLLPEIRRHFYLRIASLYHKGGKAWRCRLFCVRAIFAAPRVDRDLQFSLLLLARSWVPRWLRVRVSRPLYKGRLSDRISS